MTPLADHLRPAEVHAPFIVADLLDTQDWTPFEDRYAATGRAPYAPRAMLGLILYGIMHGVSSLRALERLARVDLGCMWVIGGIAPDHANIGRFICLHEQALAQEFFEALTRTVLTRTATSATCLAGDGTVIEAACSHYRLLKEEAVRARVSDARTHHKQAPREQQDKTRQQLERAQACEQWLDARIAARRRHGKRTDTVHVSPDRMARHGDIGHIGRGSSDTVGQSRGRRPGRASGTAPRGAEDVCAHTGRQASLGAAPDMPEIPRRQDR